MFWEWLGMLTGQWLGLADYVSVVLVMMLLIGNVDFVVYPREGALSWARAGVAGLDGYLGSYGFYLWYLILISYYL
ncbi:hypothetical protein BJX61DRAFT_527839 [Aspergillus egyptiacus]|nr:hypothetical protein BJX61DRAFT_527839 [Aspergillus egyptiacus]